MSASWSAEWRNAWSEVPGTLQGSGLPTQELAEQVLHVGGHLTIRLGDQLIVVRSKAKGLSGDQRKEAA